MNQAIYLTDLFLLMLALWRISSLFVDEPGIFSIAQIIRDLVGVVDGVSAEYQPNPLAGIFSCIWCFSFWAGIAMTVAFYYEPEKTRLFMLPFALSAGAIIWGKLANYRAG